MFLSTFFAITINIIYAYADSKEKSVGSDGFSDCSKLCNPENGYPLSCRLYCKGFKFPDGNNSESKSHNFPWSVVLGVAVPLVVLTIILSTIYRYRTVVCKERENLKMSVEESGDGKRRTETTLGEEPMHEALDLLGAESRDIAAGKPLGERNIRENIDSIQFRRN